MWGVPIRMHMPMSQEKKITVHWITVTLASILTRPQPLLVQRQRCCHRIKITGTGCFLTCQMLREQILLNIAYTGNSTIMINRLEYSIKNSRSRLGL